jgi:hypothetical protein
MYQKEWNEERTNNALPLNTLVSLCLLLEINATQNRINHREDTDLTWKTPPK